MGAVNLVVGPKGVGKTTVLSEFTSTKPDVRHVHFGEKLAEIAGMEGIDVDGESLGPTERTYLRRRTSVAVKQLATEMETPVVVDTHFLFPTRYGFVPGLLVDNVRTLDPERILVFDASAETIQRRLRDGGQRSVLYESLEQIERHRELGRIAATCAAATVGARIYFVDNDSASVEETAERVEDVFERDEELMV